MNRYVCVHGHFYQPPRENPWLEAIEQQESAYPYHDWNERITAECYGPNAHARILDDQRRIVRIVSNYVSMSYNFGPTLLAWMQREAPDEYAAVIAADARSSEHFGHGSAIAQAYNHIIMPLATERDQRTQVLWGLADFRHRFGREAEGMWLPETAASTSTLETLAAAGVKFTILAPRQAAAVRELGADAWTDVTGARIDPLRPYVCHLPSGRSIALFFYDGPVSRAVAFEALLDDGERLARRLLGLLGEGDGTPIASIATDGETYGHHHRHGEMALAWALRQVDISGTARLTNYAAHLATHPPRHEVRIVENSSWSCAHGVERWRADCGCHAGGRAGWTQAWRAPLRAAFDWLRDTLEPRYEESAGELVADPWAVRDAYIDVVLDRSATAVQRFVATHARRSLEDREVTRLFKLLEMQRNAMLMYTSCGWFFNDVSGIETVQVLQYAARATQLAEEVFGTAFEQELLEHLERAHSNVPEERNAKHLYTSRVRPLRVDLPHVAAHRVVSALFENSALDGQVYCYEVEGLCHEVRVKAETTLSVGRVRVTSLLTREEESLSFAVLHTGGHEVSGGIRRHDDPGAFERREQALIGAFERDDMVRVANLLAEFPDYEFSLRSLFADRQREILHRMLDKRIDAAEVAYRSVYDRNVDLLRFLIELELPVPRAFTMAAEFVLNRDLRRSLDPARPDIQHAEALLHAARTLDIPLDRAGIAFAAARTMASLVRALADDPGLRRLEQLADLATFIDSLAFEVDLWAAQNEYYALAERILPEMRARAEAGDPEATAWITRFREVGQQLEIAIA